MSAQNSFVSVPSATRLTAAVAGFLMQSIGSRYEATPTVAADGQYQSIRINSDGTVIVSDAALLAALGAIDFATETTLDSLLTAFNAEDFATQTTLAALLAAFSAEDFATETTLAGFAASFSGTDFATETTVDALLTAFNAEDFATQTTLASIESFLTAYDFASETTLSTFYALALSSLAKDSTVDSAFQEIALFRTQYVDYTFITQAHIRSLEKKLSTAVSVTSPADTTDHFGVVDGYTIGQQFLVPAGGMKVQKIKVKIKSNSNASQSGKIALEIRANKSTVNPSTEVMVRSLFFDAAQMTVPSTIYDVEFVFRDCPQLLAGQTYWITSLYQLVSNGTGGSWYFRGGGAYADGVFKYENPPSTWTAAPPDIYFSVEGFVDTLATIPVSISPAAAIGLKQAAITVGTTAVRLTHDGSAPSSGRKKLSFMPDPASAANFYYGSSSVTSSGATRGLPVFPGQTVDIENPGAEEWYIISDTAAQTAFVVEQEA